MEPTVLAQLIINGILLGGVYALAAFGLSRILGVSGGLHVATREFRRVSGCSG